MEGIEALLYFSQKAVPFETSSVFQAIKQRLGY
jgi:hypothetical protein